MVKSRTEIIELNQFLKVIGSQYKHFCKEISTLHALIDEIEVEDEVDNYYFKQLQKTQKENEMLRKDLFELSKEHFKK
jgi:ribosome-associated protein YbcJ (S4-like RNA binding protein)